MSYDLLFAKPKRKIARKRLDELYLALGRGEPVEAFDILPLDAILNALREAYEDFEPAVKFPTIEDGRGSAEVSQTSQCFTFCFRGDAADIQKRITGILRGFGCPVFDPQASILYPLDQPSGSSVGGDSSTVKPPSKTDAEREEKVAGLRALAEQAQRKRREENRGWYEPVENLAAQIARDCAGGRWQRFGLDPEAFAAVLHNMKLFEQNATESRPDDILLGTTNLNLIWLGYLQAIPPGHEFSDSCAQARAGVARAIEYFYGSFRDGYREYSYSNLMDRDQTRAKLNWIKPYREGLLMALYIDDETAVRRLLEWTGTDLPVDDGLQNLTAGDNDAHIALALLLRGAPRAELSRVVDKIRASKRKRANVFWAAAEAIAAAEPRVFAQRLKELCDLYRKSATDRSTFPIPHVDGSILWHIARRASIALPELAEISLDRMIR